MTALGSPTARFVWDPEAQASFEALKQALSSAPVLCTFDPCRRAVLMTDASGLAVAAILTQPDDEGHLHPVAYESCKLTTAERNYPAHILELLAVVHALCIFRHYLLGSGAPRAEGCWSDFDLRTDNQAITILPFFPSQPSSQLPSWPSRLPSLPSRHPSKDLLGLDRCLFFLADSLALFLWRLPGIRCFLLCI